MPDRWHCQATQQKDHCQGQVNLKEQEKKEAKIVAIEKGKSWEEGARTVKKQKIRFNRREKGDWKKEMRRWWYIWYGVMGICFI